MPRGLPKSPGLRWLPSRANDEGDEEDSRAFEAAPNDDSPKAERAGNSYDIVAAADEVTQMLRQILVAQATPKPPVRSPVRPPAASLGSEMANRPSVQPRGHPTPRAPPRSKAFNSSLNTCTLAVFLLGLNLGLTVLLTLLVAGHSPSVFSEVPSFPVNRQPLGSVLQAPPISSSSPVSPEAIPPSEIAPTTAASDLVVPDLAAPQLPAGHGLGLFLDEAPEARPDAKPDKAVALHAALHAAGLSDLLDSPQGDPATAAVLGANLDADTAAGEGEPCPISGASNATHVDPNGRNASGVPYMALTEATLAQRRSDAEAACRARNCKVRGVKWRVVDLQYLRRMRAHHCSVRAQIYYVHVHKSGGTTLCQAAGANGLKVSLGTNCLYKDKTGKPVSTWWIPPSTRLLKYEQAIDVAATSGHFASCAPLLLHVISGAFLAMVQRGTAPVAPRAAERPDRERGRAVRRAQCPAAAGAVPVASHLHRHQASLVCLPSQGGPGVGLAFVITVRNPLDRVLSHFRHEKASPKDTPLRRMSFKDFVRDPGFVHWRDNFYVRLVGGCGWEPTCSAAHLDSAVQALSFFSAVLITDSKETYSVGSRLVLARRLGWASADVSSAAVRKGTHVDSRAGAELAGDPFAWARLSALNALDLHFHAAATATFRRQVVGCVAEVLADPSGLPSGLPSVAELAAALGQQGSAVGWDQASKNSGLAAPEADRSGFGGHTAVCKGEGGMSLEECRARLLAVRRACDGLSFKDGQCYLHRTSGAGFYTDASMGHLFQRFKT